MPTDTSPHLLDGVIVRQAVAGDIGFIFSTWLRDWRDNDASMLPDDLWFPAHRAFVERLLADPKNVVLIAAAADMPNEILGYIVARPQEILFWVMIRKGPLREKGLAKMLLQRAQCLPGTISGLATQASRARLLNPVRSRQVRKRLRESAP